MNIGLYLHQARRWALFAVLPALIMAVIGYGYAHREPKLYQTTATLYVQSPGFNGSGVPGGTDVYGSEALIPTYTGMLASPVIAGKVNSAMASRYPGYDLGAHSLVIGGTGPAANAQSTQLLNVTVQDTVPARAAAAANAVVSEFAHYINQISAAQYKGEQRALQQQLDQAQLNIQLVSQRIADYHGASGGLTSLKASLNGYQSIYSTLLTSSQQFRLARDSAVNGVKVFSPAPVPSGAISPHPSRNALLVGFIALIICAGAIYLYDYFDDTARTPEEVEEVIGAPILGTVQEFGSQRDGSLITAERARSPLAEAYRVIRTNLQYIDVDHPPRTIVVTSASPSEGKSTTVSNLANVIADGGRRVMLVDGDLRRPSLHRVFKLGREVGLTNMLISNERLNGHAPTMDRQPNLRLVASGPVPPRPADLLGSARMRDVIEHMRNDTDLVLIDSPPVLAVADAAILSTQVDGVILVVDPAKSKRRDLRRAREAIEAVGGKVLGVVINRLNKHGSSYYYYYYRHNYGYEYKYDYSSAPTRESEKTVDVPAGRA